ncbi:hypothetical protein D5038_20850 [Verminephrobacter aporrectodeae subsp. tuberculatae]|uniref:hypothetical protein n=1 Tax=Verminephrobacter aporrectodeae TaxID=1110389 RepID=UPI002238DA4B|nr:hypothetical protein [Verminephrobacter aporrectodeae]MCW5258706.1 hypothetical protein [Verminephrobacter aporrectodeae subsp. tuberculatae]
MEKSYIRISIVTDIDTTKWEFGRKVLETFCETDPRLVPDGFDYALGEKIKRPFYDIAACEKYWAAEAIIESGNERTFTKWSCGWKRSKAVKYRYTMRHTLMNRLGELRPGWLRGDADANKKIDWSRLFHRLIEFANPQFAILHLFTNIETRDDAFGTDEHAIVAADHFLAGPPAAVLEDEGIPNLGWATFFGRDYTKEIDAEKLRANGFAVEAIGDGHLVTLTENIFDVADNFPLFSARRSELKKLLRPGFIRLTNEPQASELPENSTPRHATPPDPDNTGKPAGMIGGNSGVSLSLDSTFKAQLQIAAATKAPYSLLVTPLNQVISKELWDRVHEVQGTVYQINPPTTIETIRILRRPKSAMRVPYIKISIVTDIDTTKWEFGRKVLEAFYETDSRLAPGRLDSDAKIWKLFRGVAACEKYWAKEGIINANKSGRGRVSVKWDCGWTRSEAVEYRYDMIHTMVNQFGELRPGWLKGDADADRKIDWRRLFHRLVELANPQFAILHLFTDVETRDDAFGADEHAIIATDDFLMGPPAAILKDRGIPNLAWATFFGREYTQEIDAEKLRANGFAVEAMGDGHLVTLTKNIFDVADNFPLFSARRSELKKLLRPGFIRLTNEPLNQATSPPVDFGPRYAPLLNGSWVIPTIRS